MRKLFVASIKKYIRPILFFCDSISVSSAWALALYLHGLTNQTTPDFFNVFLHTLPLFLGVNMVLFHAMGLYRVILRYASFLFAITLIKAVSLGALLSTVLVLFINPAKIPFNIFVSYWFFSLILMGLSRFLPRYYTETTLKFTEGEKNILIYGAGDVGDALARSLMREKHTYNVVGFIDDNPRKIGLKVQNIPVLGTIHQLTELATLHDISEMIVAITRYRPEALRNLVKQCRDIRMICRLAPTVPGMLQQDVHIKNIDISDLLKRNPEDLDERQIDHFLRDKTVLITGAAGSIGSELVRQVIRFNVAPW